MAFRLELKKIALTGDAIRSISAEGLHPQVYWPQKPPAELLACAAAAVSDVPDMTG
jgi:hypothetical protein